jgi:gamma-glutamyltranspeptidase/glutathione hydrolase/leukotriene-C4 hydrolase
MQVIGIDANNKGIPGEIAGYWFAHKLAGKLPWRRLFEPTIDLCRTGLAVSDDLAKILKSNDKQILKDKGLSKIFINPATNKVYKKNQTIRFPLMADTLEKIAEGGLDTFYNGELSQLIVNETNLKSKSIRLILKNKSFFLRWHNFV